MSSHPIAARLVAALTLAGAAVACDAATPITGLTSVASITVTASAATLAVGQTMTASATLKDAAGQPITGRTVRWSSSNLAVATVTDGGEVAAVAPGTTRIRATSGGKSGDVELTILPRSALVAEITLDITAVVLSPGETRQLTATPRDSQGAPVSGVTVHWAAAGANRAATVSATGLVAAREMGIMTISASIDGKLAQAIITVLGDAMYDLVFDRWHELGGYSHPGLHRLDMRTPDATSVAIGQLTVAQDAAPSPDGARIAFVCDNGGPAICVADHNGANAMVLPGFNGFDGVLGDQPAWSPDGARIAFRGWAPGGDPGIFNPADVWVMNADGSNKVRLTAAVKNEDSYESPTWSPRQADGSYRIAFARTTRNSNSGYMRANLESMRADGQDRRLVTTAGEYVDATPTWSPHGGTIAFVRTGGEVGGDIWLVNAAGGNERALMPAATEPSGAQRAPAWSPDGGLIAFASNHEILGTYYAWQIYTVRADGTQLVRRTSDRADSGNPAWIRRP